MTIPYYMEIMGVDRPDRTYRPLGYRLQFIEKMSMILKGFPVWWVYVCIRRLHLGKLQEFPNIKVDIGEIPLLNRHLIWGDQPVVWLR